MLSFSRNIPVSLTHNLSLFQNELLLTTRKFSQCNLKILKYLYAIFTLLVQLLTDFWPTFQVCNSSTMKARSARLVKNRPKWEKNDKDLVNTVIFHKCRIEFRQGEFLKNWPHCASRAVNISTKSKVAGVKKSDSSEFHDMCGLSRLIAISFLWDA